MNVQMMEGLLGTSSNLKLAGTPVSVYRQASAEGDTEKMRRALGYTGECTEKAAKYQEELDEGMEAEAQAAREKAKLEREAAIERRREERERAESAEESERSPEDRSGPDQRGGGSGAGKGARGGRGADRRRSGHLHAGRRDRRRPGGARGRGLVHRMRS